MVGVFFMLHLLARYFRYFMLSYRFGNCNVVHKMLSSYFFLSRLYITRYSGRIVTYYYNIGQSNLIPPLISYNCVSFARVDIKVSTPLGSPRQLRRDYTPAQVAHWSQARYPSTPHPHVPHSSPGRPPSLATYHSTSYRALSSRGTQRRVRRAWKGGR